MTAWREVGDGVLVRRHRSLDLNTGLVLGASACLVIDTRSSVAEALDLAEAVRHVTALPWLVVNTHAHFDHYFGNAVFHPAPIWGHRRCADTIRSAGEAHRHEAVTQHGIPGAADVPLIAPDHLYDTTATLDLGGRQVMLHHLGRGHTDHDTVVHVPDAAVVFAGDLVEQGAPPAFEDSYPLDWPLTLDGLLSLEPSIVVPGHGDVVDPAFVQAQRCDLASLAELARRGSPVGSSFPPEVTAVALDRAARQLR